MDRQPSLRMGHLTWGRGEAGARKLPAVLAVLGLELEIEDP